MTNDVKIEAGQVWDAEFATGHFMKIHFVNDDIILAQFLTAHNTESQSGYTIIHKDGRCVMDGYRLRVTKPSPQARPVEWEDVRELLAKYGVIYSMHGVNDEWQLVECPNCISEWKEFGGLRFSPNPWAANPVIIGPMVEVDK